MLTAGNDITQFTPDSFSLLANVSVSDTTLDVSLLNEAIVQANLATDATRCLTQVPRSPCLFLLKPPRLFKERMQIKVIDQ